ncbi:MAG: energy-coupling factor transporter transmembrane protein EcfT, partial [Firmicutes bacterium]|nr:energy-coupling factor transporter transmembrane protein EcfT [Bacillota bacterium]
MKDITLGQYFPGNSVIHRLDPRAKLLCVVLYIAMIFVASSVSGVIFSVLLTLFLIILSGIPLKIFLRGMKPVLFIVLFTTFLNLFLTS